MLLRVTPSSGDLKIGVGPFMDAATRGLMAPPMAPRLMALEVAGLAAGFTLTTLAWGCGLTLTCPLTGAYLRFTAG